MQGFVGVSRLESVTLDQSGTAPVEIDDTELDDVPFVGGGAQWKLGGTNVDLGVEGLFALGWKSNVEAFYLGGGGAVVAVDVDTLLVDLSVGPFASVFLGDKTRVYVGAGPIVQFLNYDQEEDLSGLSESGSGFGVGAYARTGIEFRISPTSLLGFGVRYTDSEIDLDDGLGDFDVEGFQGFLTMTTML
jgi:opacity protein-like surface antigen